MVLYIRIMLLIGVFGLVACGAPPQEAISSDAPSSVPATATTAPSATPSVTIVPTTVATSSATPAPTTAPTTAPTASVEPTVTATLEPTIAATASATVSATSASATTTPTSAATLPATAVQSTAQATATAIPPSVTASAGTGRSGTIAFVRDGSIYAYQLRTGAVTTLIEDGRDVQFSRDGTQLAFVRDDGLYLAAADGSAIRRIVAQSDIAAPRWTDDGSKLLFRRGLFGAAPGYSEIWTIELPQGTPLKIAEGMDPAWAPDGKRIAYVTPYPNTEYGPRRNELHLTNWRGQNDWAVVRQVPANTPPTGVPGNEIAREQLEHLLFAPAWSADGAAIYVLARATMQVETDFTLFERADPINGGSTFVETLIDVRDELVSPDRRGVLFTTSSARGDVSLTARSLDPAAAPDTYAWANAKSNRDADTVYQHFAPIWSPDSNALVTIRCTASNPEQQRCDLVLFAPGQKEPELLLANVLDEQMLDYSALPTMSWGR